MVSTLILIFTYQLRRVMPSNLANISHKLLDPHTEGPDIKLLS